MSVFQVGGGTAGAPPPTITELQSKGILTLSHCTKLTGLSNSLLLSVCVVHVCTLYPL